jgi:hypothetical protein
MSTDHHTPVTPDQVAAVAAGNGFAHVEDPATRRIYLLVDQGQAPTLTDDYFRQKIAEGLAEADRGASRPWDVAAMKANLIRRHGKSTNAS